MEAGSLNCSILGCDEEPGNEEMGGVRGIAYYMQRTAVQGSPYQKHFDELEIVDSILTEEREITLQDIGRFAELYGDRFYAHIDEAVANNDVLLTLVAKKG